MEVQPDVPGLTVDALPDDMLPLTHLRLVVTRAAWDCIRGQAYERDDYRCIRCQLASMWPQSLRSRIVVA